MKSFFSFDPKQFFLIAGPCVAESQRVCFQTAEVLKAISEEFRVQVIFKASYLKANRSSGSSYRGPGLIKGLKLLESVKERFDLPILTDVHETKEVKPVSRHADFIQIPALLCRQTALLEEAADTKLWINVKKGQFMAPWDMKNV
ncbi:MAG: 3-deoxy-8-phosphooctulonate synthase, partial [Candidatus Aureabacteria bacterium]|nr:3-deoxy-8-phosphooctulonate synthase [Candidatus Auribacterota bacterium]